MGSWFNKLVVLALCSGLWVLASGCCGRCKRAGVRAPKTQHLAFNSSGTIPDTPLLVPIWPATDGPYIQHEVTTYRTSLLDHQGRLGARNDYIHRRFYSVTEGTVRR